MATQHYKNNGELTKDIQNNVRYLTEKRLIVHCYTSCDDNIVYTDLEVDVYLKDNTYTESFTVASLEDIDKDDNKFNEIVENHRKMLSSQKKKVYNHLKRYFDNVELSDDYTQ